LEYRDFALEIIQKKFNPENILDIKEYKIFLLRLFDESSGRICDSGKAFKSLTAELKKNVTNGVIQGIIKNLKTDDPLMDKLNIYNFYKNKEEDYLKRSEFVKKNGVSNNNI
jgi:hypothetical protein